MLTNNFHNLWRNMVIGSNFKITNATGSSYSITVPNGHGISSNYIQYLTYNAFRFDYLLNQSKGNSTGIGGGVYFGTGTTPPTENDYAFAGSQLKGLTVTQTLANTSDDDSNTITATYTITNNNSSSVTIGEVLTFGNILYGSSSYYTILLDRTVLAEPVTIPAGEIGRVIYSIKVNKA